MYAAIDQLVDKLDRQVLKHKEKTARLHRHDTPVKKPRSVDAETHPLPIRCPPVPPPSKALNLIAITAASSPNSPPPTSAGSTCDVTSKKRLFEQVGLLFENNHGIARSLVFESLFARERLGSTGLGQGVAIPHGRIKGLKDAPGRLHAPEVRTGRLRRAGRQAGQIWCSCCWCPSRPPTKHLQILSELAQMFCDKPLREELMTAAADADELHQLITDGNPMPQVSVATAA